MFTSPILRPCVRFALLALGLVALSSLTQAQTTIVMADDSKPAHVTVSWPLRDGTTVKLEGDRGYKSSAQKQALGHNLDCYVAMGGTRQTKGLTNQDSASFLVGLYKSDIKKPLFEGIADNASITISLSRVFMNQPVVPRPKTTLMHLRYMLEDLAACGLSSNARNLFNSADPDDEIKNRTNGGSSRPGALDGNGADHGSVESKAHEDGSVSFTVKFPYALLRHIEDPYKRSNPGGFFEPNHFHIEMEVMKKEAAAKIDANPPSPAPKPAQPDPPPPSLPTALPPK